MGALLCCCPKNKDSDSNRAIANENSPLSATENISMEEKRRQAAEAAEKRLKQQQMRGVQGDSQNLKQMRIAHSELPENMNSNLRWQVS